MLRRYCMFEGRFNMLKAGVTYIKQTQAGYGICAVAENYAVELKRERTLFAGLPYLISLDNATDPAEVVSSIEELRQLRVEAKAKLQKHCSASFWKPKESRERERPRFGAGSGGEDPDLHWPLGEAAPCLRLAFLALQRAA